MCAEYLDGLKRSSLATKILEIYAVGKSAKLAPFKK